MLRRAAILVAVLVTALVAAAATRSIEVTYPPYPSQVTHDAAGRIVDVSWRLAFKPPALTNPIDVYISNTNRRPSIAATQDAIVHWPSTPVNPSDGGDVQIIGGRNVVSIGGAICPSTIRRGLFLKGFTGTMFVEGLQVGGDGCPLNEGIDVDTLGARGSRLVLENDRIGSPASPMQGSYATNHADVVQVWNGPATLAIDRLTGFSQYQGFMIQPRQFGSWQAGEIGLYDVRRTNLENHDGGAYAVYRADAAGTSPTSTEDFYADAATAERTDYLNRFGGITFGPPPHGDFVPAGVPGVNYVSPGYLP